MAIALLTSTSKPAALATAAVTSDPISTLGATLLLIGEHRFLELHTVQDSLGNTWLPLTEQEAAGQSLTRLWYCLNPLVGASHTFTLDSTGGGTHPTITVAAFSGVTRYAGVENGATSLAAASLSSGSVLPPEAGALIVSLYTALNSAITGVSGGSLAILENVADTANSVTAALAYEIQAAAAARAALWTNAGTPPLAAVIAAFDGGDDPRLDWQGGVQVAGAVRRYQAIPSGMTPPGMAS